jgi:uncharacterized membrane protein
MDKSKPPRSNGPGSKWPSSNWNDERVERIMGTLLQSGVIVSGLVVFAGGILYLLRYVRVPVNYETFVADRASLRSLAAVGNSALHGDGRAIIQCGLLLLIATPVARVLFSIIAFALEKDRLYVVLTLIVFIILIYSLLGGAT